MHNEKVTHGVYRLSDGRELPALDDHQLRRIAADDLRRQAQRDAILEQKLAAGRMSSPRPAAPTGPRFTTGDLFASLPPADMTKGAI